MVSFGSHYCHFDTLPHLAQGNKTIITIRSIKAAAIIAAAKMQNA